jgi:hypothetical protein
MGGYFGGGLGFVVGEFWVLVDIEVEGVGVEVDGVGF